MNGYDQVRWTQSWFPKRKSRNFSDASVRTKRARKNPRPHKISTMDVRVNTVGLTVRLPVERSSQVTIFRDGGLPVLTLDAIRANPALFNQYSENHKILVVRPKDFPKRVENAMLYDVQTLSIHFIAGKINVMMCIQSRKFVDLTTASVPRNPSIV